MIEENNVIIADGRSLPTPSDYTPYPTLREKSTENALGDLIRKIISSRWKIEMKWDILTPAQMDFITKLKFKDSFICRFPSTDGRILTKRMYVGDINYWVTTGSSYTPANGNPQNATSAIQVINGSYSGIQTANLNVSSINKEQYIGFGTEGDNSKTYITEITLEDTTRSPNIEKVTIESVIADAISTVLSS